MAELADLRLKVANLRSDKEKTDGELAHLRKQVEDAQTIETLAAESQ